MKKFLAVLLALAMVFTFAACGGEKEEATASGAIKVGCTGPLTGGAAIYGNAVKNGAEIAFEEINALGGMQFEFNMQDDAHDAEKAVNAYNDLKDWGMQLMMGTVTSAPAEATAAEAYADRVFYLTPSASSTDVTKGKDNIFQMCFADPNQGSGAAQYISEHNMAKKVGMIYKSDDNYSMGIRATFLEGCKNLGLELVAEEAFTDATSTDFTVQVKKMQDAGAELVFLPMYYTPASLIFAQAKAIGYAPTWFGVDGMDGILTLEGFDTTLAEGVVLLTPYSADDTSELNQNFVAKYQEKFGEVPNQFAADAYDCAYALYTVAAAAELTSDMAASDICDQLISLFTSMTFNGLTGSNMTWDATGAVSKSPNAMVIQNGAYVGL
ncbi:MAG: ABC transporter substrate-binding protein [Bacillota bacterium]|nr:ABC transporter substrate-binding protein [Bacillota bacterium]